MTSAHGTENTPDETSPPETPPAAEAPNPYAKYPDPAPPSDNQGGTTPPAVVNGPGPSGTAVGFPPPAATAPHGVAMKQRNAFLVWIVWPILTLGIYHFVWYYKIHNEMLHFDPRQPINPTGSLLTILFGWIIIVPPFVSYFNTGNRIATAQRAAGLAPTANPWIGFILLFIFGLTPLYYQFELNKIVDRYSVPAGSPVTLAG